MSKNHITQAIMGLVERFESAGDIANHLRRAMTTTGRPAVTFQDLCVEVRIAHAQGDHFWAATVEEILNAMVNQEAQDSGYSDDAIICFLRHGVSVGRFMAAKPHALHKDYTQDTGHLPFVRVSTMLRAQRALETLTGVPEAMDAGEALRQKLAEFAYLAKRDNLMGPDAFVGYTTEEVVEAMDPTLERT
jgi:hypothetical protein